MALAAAFRLLRAHGRAAVALGVGSLLLAHLSAREMLCAIREHCPAWPKGSKHKGGLPSDTVLSKIRSRFAQEKNDQRCGIRPDVPHPVQGPDGIGRPDGVARQRVSDAWPRGGILKDGWHADLGSAQGRRPAAEAGDATDLVDQRSRPGSTTRPPRPSRASWRNPRATPRRWNCSSEWRPGCGSFIPRRNRGSQLPHDHRTHHHGEGPIARLDSDPAAPLHRSRPRSTAMQGRASAHPGELSRVPCCATPRSPAIRATTKPAAHTSRSPSRGAGAHRDRGHGGHGARQLRRQPDQGRPISLARRCAVRQDGAATLPDGLCHRAAVPLPR